MNLHHFLVQDRAVRAAPLRKTNLDSMGSGHAPGPVPLRRTLEGGAWLLRISSKALSGKSSKCRLTEIERYSCSQNGRNPRTDNSERHPHVNYIFPSAFP